MRKIPSSFWALSLLLSLLWLGACTGTDTGNPILGGGSIDETETLLTATVLDSSGAPLLGCSVWVRPAAPAAKSLAKVSLKADTNAQQWSMVTDASGEVELRGLKPGSYVLMAVHATQGIGWQARFTLNSKDTLPLATQRLAPLQTFQLNIPQDWVGSTVYIAELGASLPTQNGIVTLTSVPTGSYTISQDGKILIFDSENTPSSSSSSLPSSSSSSPDVVEIGKESLSLDSTGNYGLLHDSRDGSLYKVARLGSGYWALENARYPVEGSTCNPNDTSSNCSIYGRFYSFTQAAQACPEGWNPPTQAQWESLILITGGSTIAGGLLKNSTGWLMGGNGAPSQSFFALPAGNSLSPQLGTEAYFWSASPSNADLAIAMNLAAGSSTATLSSMDQTLGLSVRCFLSI